MQKITPFLWFDGNAEEAVNHYLSIFKDGKINKTAKYGKEGPGPEGSTLTIEFTINGMDFVALNGGPQFKFTEAVSFVVNCKDQAEVDYYWEKLSADGEKSVCGWLKDKFGLSWQIVPERFWEIYSSGDAEQSSRVMQAMMKMTKFVIVDLEAAAKK